MIELIRMSKLNYHVHPPYATWTLNMQIVLLWEVDKTKTWLKQAAFRYYNQVSCSIESTCICFQKFSQ